MKNRRTAGRLMALVLMVSMLVGAMPMQAVYAASSTKKSEVTTTKTQSKTTTSKTTEEVKEATESAEPAESVAPEIPDYVDQGLPRNTSEWDKYLESHETPYEGMDGLEKPTEYFSGDYEVGLSTKNTGSLQIWVPKYYTDFDKTSWWFTGSQGLRASGVIMGDDGGRVNYNRLATTSEIYTMIVRFVLSDSFAGETIRVEDDNMEALLGDYVFHGRHAWKDAFTTVHTYLGDTLHNIGIDDFSLTPDDPSYVPTRAEAYVIYALGALAKTADPKWYLEHFDNTRLGYMVDIPKDVALSAGFPYDQAKDRKIFTFDTNTDTTTYFTSESIKSDAAELTPLQIQCANLLMYIGVLNGKQDKSLHNSDKLTRAEAAKLLQSIENVENDPNSAFRHNEKQNFEKADEIIKYVWLSGSNNTISEASNSYWTVQWYNHKPTGENDTDAKVLSWTLSKSDTELPEYPGATPTEHNKRFTGWSEPEKDTENRTITYYGQWVEAIDEYKLTYQLDGGYLPRGTSNPESYTIETETFSLQNPVKENYTFAGWTGPGLTGVTDTVTIKKGSTGDREYTAIWVKPPVVTIVPTEPRGFSITYDLGGGVIQQNNPSWYYETTETFTLNNPVREGYIFAGWEGTDLDAPQKSVTIEKGSKGERSYTATWTPTEPGTYTVVYHLNGGRLEGKNPETYTSETEDFTLINPTKAGYTFLGWTGTNQEEASTSVTVAKGSSGNLVYSANWELNTYAIQYDLVGGSLVANNPTAYTVNSETFTLNNPTKEGFVFAGWTGTGITEAKAIVSIQKGSTGDRTYTATWVAAEAETYSIHYNLVHGTVNGSNPSVYTSETPTFTLINPTRVGYEFLGWTGTGLTEATGSVTITQGSKGDRQYFAGWQKLNYNIVYDLDGGAVVHNNPTYYDITTETFTLANPTREGYTFTGWTGTDLEGASTTVTVAKGSTGNRAYKATWTAKAPDTYNIIYHVNGGVIEGTNPATYTADTESFTLVNPTREGYDFVGWVGTGVSTPSRKVTITKGSMGNRDYSAMWQAKLYRIRYKLDGGTLASNNPTAYYASDSDFTLNNPTKTGFVFAGWVGTGLTSATGTVTIASGSTGDREYTATWTEAAPGSYSITYHLDGGVVDGTNPAVFTVESETFTLVNPTKSGYKFVGWAGTGIESPTQTVKVEKGSTGNRDYSAIWELIGYKITYDLDGGAVGENNLTWFYSTNDSFTLSNPTKDGYVFAGWIGTGLESATVDVTIEKGSTGDRAYKATWTEADPDEYDIYYNLAGGTLSGATNPDKYTKKSAEFTLRNPAKAGFNFIGWSGTGLTELTTEVKVATGSTGDRYYTANWESVDTKAPLPNDPNREDGSLHAENVYEAMYLSIPQLTLNGEAVGVQDTLHEFRIYLQEDGKDTQDDITDLVRLESDANGVKSASGKFSIGSFGSTVAGARMRITPKTTPEIKIMAGGDATEQERLVGLRDRFYDVVENADTATSSLSVTCVNKVTGEESAKVPLVVDVPDIVEFRVATYSPYKDIAVKVWVPDEAGNYTTGETFEIRKSKSVSGLTENFEANLNDYYLNLEKQYGTLDKTFVSAVTADKVGTNMRRNTEDYYNDMVYKVYGHTGAVGIGMAKEVNGWSNTVFIQREGLAGKQLKLEVSAPGFLPSTQTMTVPSTATNGVYNLEGFSYPTNYVWYDGYYDMRGEAYIDNDNRLAGSCENPVTGENVATIFGYQKTLVLIPDPDNDGKATQADLDMMLKYGYLPNPSGRYYDKAIGGDFGLTWSSFSTTFDKNNGLWGTSIYNKSSEQYWNDYTGAGMALSANNGTWVWSPEMLLRVANQNVLPFMDKTDAFTGGQYDPYLGKVIKYSTSGNWVNLPVSGSDLATGYEYDVVRHRPVKLSEVQALGLQYDYTAHTVVKP